MAPVDVKIGIRREKERIVQRFSHAHQTGIRQTHRPVRIFLNQSQRPFEVLSQTECANHGAAPKQSGKGWAAARIEEVKSLGHHGFAGDPGRRKPLRLGCRPGVMGVAAAQQSNQKARINEDVSGRSPYS